MKLLTIYEALATGELSQLSVGGADAGQVDEGNQDRVIPHINLALTALYTRFNLKQGRVRLNMLANRTLYPLGPRFYEGNLRSREVDRYLVPAVPKVYPDDILKIERVLTDAGGDLVLNDEHNPYSLYTPTHTSLRLPVGIVAQGFDLPDVYRTAYLTVVYRAKHPTISIEQAPEVDMIELPESHLEALLYFVASRMHMPVGMNPQANQGDPFMARYEKACQMLENKGMQQDHTNSWDRLRDRGFV